MKIQFLVIIAFSVFVTSCSEGLLGDMLRVIADPVVKVPVVVSFEKEETIEINWDKDPGADEYVIYKALDQAIPVYEILYEGSDLNVVDTNAIEGNRYLYTLGKVRGTKLFGPSDTVLGIGSMVINDHLENNNSKDNATNLDLRFDANIYYYQSYAGAKLKDTDWYYVIVPPGKQAEIIITYDQSGGIGLYFYLEGHPVKAIVSGGHLSVINDTDREASYYFQISPNTSTFISDPAAGGGNLVDYNIFLHSIITP